MYWCRSIKTIPSPGRGAADRAVAGRGLCATTVNSTTPTSSFPREGIAQAKAFFNFDNTIPSPGRGAADREVAGRGLTLFIAAVFLFVTGLSACKPDIKETGATTKYFDLKAYFKADSARLSKLPQPILKTVTHNGVTETKKVRINNWMQELSLFTESDINKPAWRDSYKIQQTDNTLIYMAIDSTLKTREIMIHKKDGRVNWLVIYNYTHNMLYTTHEKLSYIPDSIYTIEKIQHVKLLGTNRYTITGNLN